MCNSCGQKLQMTRDGMETGESTKPTKVCMGQYPGLQAKNLVLLDLIKANPTDLLLKEINKVFRVWAKDLKNNCPPETEKEVYFNYIDGYTNDI